MRRFTLYFITALLLICLSISCSHKHESLTRVVVTGEANAQAQPETAVLVLSVVTQSQRALDAQQENARRSEAVMRAVQATAGANTSVKTSDYSLEPQKDYRENRLPKIIGYDARNTVTVTMSDLNNVGAVIDAASRAGANSIERVSFILREDNPARSHTLADATHQAICKAQSIAEAVGGHIVHIVDEQESGTINRPVNTDYETAANYGTPTRSFGIYASKPAITTPLEAGSLNVKSQVQITVEIAASQ